MGVLVGYILYFILDIGLIVILHSIRENKGSFGGSNQERQPRPTPDNAGITEQNIVEMDRSSVEKIKLTQFGFRWNLIRFSSFLSVLGIVVSTLGTIGSIATLGLGIGFSNSRREWPGLHIILIVSGMIVLVIMTLYLAMWISLKKKTNKRDIASIERIGKIYSYMSGALEIIAMVTCLFAYLVHFYHHWFKYDHSYDYEGYFSVTLFIFILLFATVDLIFTCLKIYGIWLKKNKLLGIYLGYRYAFFFFTILFGVIGTIYVRGIEVFIGPLLGQVLVFVLDIGLTVILHSIRADRGSLVGMENPLNDW